MVPVGFMRMLEHLSHEERGFLQDNYFDYFLDNKNREEVEENVKKYNPYFLPIISIILDTIDTTKKKYQTTCENRSKRKNKDTSDTTKKTQIEEAETNDLTEEQNEIFRTCTQIYLRCSKRIEDYNQNLAKMLNQKQLVELMVCLYMLGCKSLEDLYEKGTYGFLNEISNTNVKITISNIKSICKNECLKEDFDTLTDYEKQFKRIKKVLETTDKNCVFSKT